MQERLGVGADALSATMRERLDAMRDLLGGRAAVVPGAMAERTGASGTRVDAPASRAGTGALDEARLVQAALADLRLPDLPAARPRSSFWRRVTRVNPLSLDWLEDDPALAAYWRRTRRAVSRLELWRLNPVVLTWNLGRGLRQALGFFVAMHGERY